MMKKAMVVCAALCAAGALYGQETARNVLDSRLAGGLAWGNYFDSYKEGGKANKDFTSSLGAQFYSDVFFKGQSTGVFSHLSLLFPVHYSEKVDGKDAGVDRGDFGLMLQFDALVGSAMKFELGSRAELGVGLGVHAFMGTYDITDQVGVEAPSLQGLDFRFESATGSMYSLGIGLDLNFSLQITGKVFLGLGTAVSLDFLKTVQVDTEWNVDGQLITISAKDKLSGYLGWNVKPYLVIGVRSWQITEFGYGKLPASKASAE